MFELRKAKTSEAEAILRLYRCAAKAEGCTWDEGYPNAQTVAEDLAAESLYVLDMEGKPAGCVSVVPENELDGLDCWQVTESCCEIARVAIDRQLQGRGLSKELLRLLFAELSRQGLRSVHILVAEQNLIARRTYASLGFEFYGNYFMFGHDFIAAEKLL
ncbi:MAG: GNAT family N-acetyltransferase [Ruminococcus sp.]|nr:GNAT family N-acetyltransferase [Ruminococcus sp.]